MSDKNFTEAPLISNVETIGEDSDALQELSNNNEK